MQRPNKNGARGLADPTILLAVKSPDQLTEGELAAVSWIKRFKAKVELAHVCEPWQARAWLAHLPGEAMTSEIASLIEGEEKEHALTALAKVFANLQLPATDKPVILHGDAATALSDHAKKINAWLLCCGIADVNYRYVPAGLSTPLGLAQSSSAPLLFLPSRTKKLDQKERLRILIADDLGPHSDKILQFAAQLALQAGQIDLLHVHICDLREQAIKRLQEQAKTSQLGSELEQQLPTEKEGMSDLVQAALQERLRSRFAKYFTDQLQDADVTYHCEVHFGKPSEAIVDVAKNTGADLMVFGRHKTFRQHPFSLGKLPLTAMLNYQIPVAVVGTI